MAQINIADLSRSLTENKARWVATENPISVMDSEVRKRLLGFDNLTALKVPFTLESLAVPVLSFAPAVDWRNRNGNHVTSVKMQGGCGSCVSFCTVAITESMASIEKGQLLDLSEADQHFCSSHGASCGGWNHIDAFNQIKSRGVADEACFPYATAFPGNDIWNANPTCNVCGDRDARAVKITDLHNLNSYQEAKDYLTNTGPIAAAFAVYTDFYNYHDGVYHYVSGVLEGYHCIAIIGYSEIDQCWICKNSWDTTWGMGGYFKIAYGECEIDTYTKVGVTGVILPTPAHGWYGFENLGGLLTSRPNAASWSANRIDVVVRGLDSAVWHKWWNGSGWYGWETLGGLIQGAPAICSWGSGRLDVFAVGLNHHLWHKWYQGGWSGWEDLGGLLSSEPACVSWGSNRIDIFAMGTNASMWHKWWDGNWYGWEDLGGIINTAPAVSSWAAGRLDCFVRGLNNHLYHKWYDNGWSGWEDLGSNIYGSPAAASWGPNRIDVFFPSQYYSMAHKWWDGANWSADEDLGGLISSDVGVCSWQAGRLDCFVQGTDSSLYHKWYV